METIELWPLSQGEIDGSPDGFVDAAFAKGPQLEHDSGVSRDEYIDRIIRGGLPDAVARSGRRRTRFLDSYVADLINRDVVQLSEIERGREMHTLVRLLAARVGQQVIPAALANELEMTSHTVNWHLRPLEEVRLLACLGHHPGRTLAVCPRPRRQGTRTT